MKFKKECHRAVLADPKAVALMLRHWISQEHADEFSGRQCAAIFCCIIGAKASQVFRYLREDEIETLTFEIARISYLSKEDCKTVYKKFKKFKLKPAGGIDHARKILEESFGISKTIDIIGKLTSPLRVDPFSWLVGLEDKAIHKLISNELPQIAALVLTHLPPERTFKVLGLFEMKDSREISYRISTMRPVSPDIIREIERVLERSVESPDTELGGQNYVLRMARNG